MRFLACIANTNPRTPDRFQKFDANDWSRAPAIAIRLLEDSEMLDEIRSIKQPPAEPATPKHTYYAKVKHRHYNGYRLHKVEAIDWGNAVDLATAKLEKEEWIFEVILEEKE